MTKQTRTTLKNYYSTGKVPTQQNYHDLIESQLNLADEDTQVIPSISSSHIEVGAHLGGHITASGNLKIEGYLSGSGNRLLIKDNISASGGINVEETLVATGSITTNSHITASGNISGSVFYASNITASGNLKIEGSSSFLGPITHPLTASEDISSSADIYCDTIYGTVGTSATITDLGLLQHLYVNGPTQITGSVIQFVPTSPLDIIGSVSCSGDLRVGNEISGSNLMISNHITASGHISSSATITGLNISASGDIIAPNIGTGVDNRVVILDSDGTFKHDTINSDVWSTSRNFVDASSGVNDRIPTFTDADSIQGEPNLTFNGSTLTVTGTITAASINTAGDITAGGIFINKEDTSRTSMAWDSGGTEVTDGRAFITTFTSCPTLPAKFNAAEEYMIISNSYIAESSTIIGTCSLTGAAGDGEKVMATPYRVTDESFRFSLSSLNGTSDIGDGATVVINWVVL